MPEPEFLGMGISILVNIGVAVGTILMAIFTYKAVRVSEKQMDLNRKLIEKPRVLEIIQNVLNNIQSDLRGEQKEISEQNIKWFKNSDRNNLYIVPLVFPLSEKKNFYYPIRYRFVGPEKGNKQIYSQLIQSIDKNLKERRIVYRSIEGGLLFIQKEVMENNFQAKTIDIFSKLPNYSMNHYDSDNGDLSVTYVEGSDTVKIKKDDLFDIIFSMMISLIFNPSRPDIDMSGYLGYQKLITELRPLILESLENNPIPDIGLRLHHISGDMNELESLNKAILEDIEELKGLYRDEYVLTEEELNPFFGGKFL